MFDAFSASSAWPTMSLPANSRGVLARMRATSSATLPMPITTAVWPERSGSRSANCGMAVVPADERGAAEHVGQLAPGMSSGRSFGAPVASTTASYSSRSSGMVTSVPTATLPTKRTLSLSAVFSYRRETALIDW